MILKRAGQLAWPDHDDVKTARAVRHDAPREHQRYHCAFARSMIRVGYSLAPLHPWPVVHIAGGLPGDYLMGQGTRMNIRAQADLFAAAPDWPQGFRYEPSVISATEELRLVEQIRTLPFKEFEFQGFLGKRRVVSFGWRYDFNGGGFQKTDSIPEFLLPLRESAARFAGIDDDTLAQALVLEYPPGAAIGWHKDRPVFDDVVGVSLVSPCTFRFRRQSGSKWERRSLTAEPRSMYLLRGPSRTEWEHSIPGVDALRYSVTFRSLGK